MWLWLVPKDLKTFLCGVKKLHEFFMCIMSSYFLLSRHKWTKMKSGCRTHLLNTGTSTEADVRVDVTLHLSVVVAVCLREREQKDFNILNSKQEEEDQCETKHVFSFKHNSTTPWNTSNWTQWGKVFCGISGSHSHSSESFTFVSTVLLPAAVFPGTHFHGPPVKLQWGVKKVN